MLRLRHLLAALVVCAALFAVMRDALRIGPAYSGLAARTEGSFTEGGGWFKGEPFVTHRPVRAWGSWNGSDENTGSLILGPFPAPAQLRFAVGGYPPYAGNSLRIERVGSGETIPISVVAVGERWRVVDQILPTAWVGQPVQLVAIDAAKGLGGWLAVTEPIRGGVGDGATGLWQSLAAWAGNGLLLGLLWLAAVRWLAPRRLVPEPWLPLAGLGVVAALGYATFWAYFAHPTAGVVCSVAILGAAALVCWRTAEPAGAARVESSAVLRLMLLIGVLYLALLHLLPSSLDFYHLAANRFRHSLPTDNELPYEVASRLYAGESLRRPDTDWISSDRPPLQSGWQLLTWSVLDWLGVAPRPASGTASLWFQLAWVAAAYGLLRTLRLGVGRASAWVAVMALSGFFLQNTTFTWPKLSAAAFACGAFGLWVLTPRDSLRRRMILVGAVLAALAWLSHGGVAFSYLVLAPWILWRCLRGEWRHWLWAALLFGLCAAPWVAYQKFYDPPGNRLLKWHLGGQIPKDARGTWQTIRENYSALSWEKIWENKRQNLAQQNSGRWEALFEFDPEHGIDRRNQEFFITARAFTWWALALLVFPLAWRRLDPTTAPADASERRQHAALFWWTALTIPLWCLLLFQGEQAVIHQGSYAAMLTAFVLLSAWFDRAGRAWLPIIATLQTVTLVTTWLPGNSVVHAAASPVAIALAGLGGGALAIIAWRGWRESVNWVAAEAGLPGQVTEQSNATPLASRLLTSAATAEEPNRPAASAIEPTSRWDSASAWIAAGVALLPAIVCARALADLFWFGDDWDLLDQIQRVGFWRWTLQPFAENLVPLFKLLWGGLVFAGGGGYATLITALWLTHALNAALFARLLRCAGVGFAGTSLATALFALSAANIETLAWSVQWSALLAVTFFLLAALLLIRRLNTGGALGGGMLVVLALLSAASALAFARGVLTGGALAVVCLLPFGSAPAPRARRLGAAAACLLPAVAVAVAIVLWSPGNHHALGKAWQNILQFGFCYWAATPLHRLLGCEVWHWPLVFGLGTLKLLLLGWAFRCATREQRPLLVLLLVLDLGNAFLLGIGRHHTGLPAANSERYYYMALLCTLPFVAVAFERWLGHLPTPRLRLALATGVVLLAAWLGARGWPAATEGFAAHRGRNTRDLLLRQPNPPAENAVPGIPFLPTPRAKELIAIYGLH